MKSKPTITILITILAVLGIIFPAHAATTVEVGIPGQVAPGGTITSIPEYIKYIYLFVMGFVGIAGFASIVFWGAVWTGSGIVDKKRQAIDGIKNALYGIGIALVSFILLNTINPDLVTIKAPNVSDVKITGSSKDTLGAMTQLQLDLAYKDCRGKDQALCVQDARCGWVDDRSRGGGSYCTSKQAAQCAAYRSQYQDCGGATDCQKQAETACNASNTCEFSGGSCAVRIRAPSGAGGNW